MNQVNRRCWSLPPGVLKAAWKRCVLVPSLPQIRQVLLSANKELRDLNINVRQRQKYKNGILVVQTRGTCGSTHFVAGKFSYSADKIRGTLFFFKYHEVRKAVGYECSQKIAWKRCHVKSTGS